MKRVLNGLRNAAFFLLCYAQIPLIAGYILMGDCVPLLMVQAALLPLSFLISLLPGKVGGKPKNQNVMVVRTSRGSDPDPDRALRNEALPEPQRRAFPLRVRVRQSALPRRSRRSCMVLDFSGLDSAWR